MAPDDLSTLVLLIVAIAIIVGAVCRELDREFLEATYGSDK